jgi:hypothetical protein
MYFLKHFNSDFWQSLTIFESLEFDDKGPLVSKQDRRFIESKKTFYLSLGQELDFQEIPFLASVVIEIKRPRKPLVYLMHECEVAFVLYPAEECGS